MMLVFRPCVRAGDLAKIQIMRDDYTAFGNCLGEDLSVRWLL